MNSDYGYYGKTGDFENPDIPIVDCFCGKKPKLICYYDDIPGFRETIYQLECECGTLTDASSEIDYIIKQWNKKQI